MRAVTAWPVDVGEEKDAVRHRTRHIPFDVHTQRPENDPLKLALVV